MEKKGSFQGPSPTIGYQYFLCQTPTLGPRVQWNLLNLLQVTKQCSDPSASKSREGVWPGGSSKERMFAWVPPTAVIKATFLDCGVPCIPPVLHLPDPFFGGGQPDASEKSGVLTSMIIRMTKKTHKNKKTQPFLYTLTIPGQFLYVKMAIQSFLKIQSSGRWKKKESWKRGDVEAKAGQPKAAIV